jgi:hypothetical protein
LTEVNARRHASFPKAVGLVHGLNLVAGNDWRDKAQNAFYKRWESDYFSSQILVFLPDGCIGYAFIKARGGWHDLQIAQDLYDTMLRLPAGY